MLELAGNSLISKFTGGIHLSELGTALTDFAYNSVGFFAIVSGLPANGFSNAKLLFQSLKDIGNVPNTGGVFQWFAGEKDFDGIIYLSSVMLCLYFINLFQEYQIQPK